MTSHKTSLEEVLSAVQSLRDEVGELRERLAALEGSASRRTAPADSQHDTLSEELVLTISAAIAAYLGVKPHIRQIRLLGSASWAQQGRATIQASHHLSVHHG